MEKILIIEDDAVVRAGIVDLLSEEGFETLEAGDGKQGIEYAKKYLPDLIISDILMPEVDGYGVFEELQKEIKTCSIPFIFLSARTDNSDIRYGMNLGADDYLTKPYKADDLISAVNTRLSRNRSIDKKLNALYSNIAKSLPHELRTPLVSIMGFSEIIHDNYDELDKYEILEMTGKIKSSGDRLLSLIQKFLLFSEIEFINADRRQLREFPGSNILPVKEAIYSMAKFALENSVRKGDLLLNLCEGDIAIDYNHFRFIIEQLLDNACKYSDAGTEIRIESYRDDQTYTIEISDKGLGMTQEQLKEIGVLKQFDRERYFQNGVGMSIGVIKKLVQLYGGTFGIESEKDRFTKVIVSFKLK